MRLLSLVKRILSLILIFALSLFVVSCSEKSFGHAELSIALSERFEEVENENFDKTYTNGISVVAIYRISHQAAFNQGLSDALTAEQFARLYMNRSDRKSEIKFRETTPYYEYTAQTDGIGTAYLASFYRSKYAYFLVLFACPEGSYEGLKSEFFAYIDSVIFTYKRSE